MNIKSKLIVAVSSRALFDLDESHGIFMEDVEKYEAHQKEMQHVPLSKGHAFHLVEKLLRLNDTPDERTKEKVDAVEVIVVSQNSVKTGRRVSNSIKHYDLPITRMIFTSGDDPVPYLVNEDLKINLFLSQRRESVRTALQNGVPSALIMSGNKSTDDTQIRIAFDGDNVLFSDESERIFQEEGLEAFIKHESENIDKPLNPGPLIHLFHGICELKKHFPTKIINALITARDQPAGDRVFNSFDHWNMHTDQALLLGGLPKRNFVKAFRADLFFDDHPKHCTLASEHSATAHVITGVTNEEQ
ncbi:5'-nucleotidase [Alteromonas macleodii]|uniref:5'-nucleotidase n=1 Tax=Alteromonas macleodii TaxID=28108 RepID=UPI003140315B|tara:strand:- start:181343 stop:182248 length:906 start_codon:yes stop_codon:yes gene_type:complete